MKTVVIQDSKFSSLGGDNVSSYFTNQEIIIKQFGKI